MSVCRDRRGRARSVTRKERCVWACGLAAACAFASVAQGQMPIRQSPQPDLQLQQSPQSGLVTGAGGVAPHSPGPIAATPGAIAVRRAVVVPRAARPVRAGVATKRPVQHRGRREVRAQASPASAQIQPMPATSTPPWLQHLQAQLQRDEAGEVVPELAATLAAHRNDITALRDADLAQRLGWSAMRRQQAAEAAVWFQQSLGNRPGQPAVRYGLALAMRDSGQTEAAYASIADDTDEKVRALRADLAMTLAQTAQERHDEAARQRWLRIALAAGRADDGLRSELAWTAYHLGENEEAAEGFGDLYARHADADNATGLFYSLQRLKRTDEIDRLDRAGGPIAVLARRAQSQALLDLGLPGAAAALRATGMPTLAGVLEPSVQIGAASRDKGGTPGSSRLQIRRLPDVSLRWPAGPQLWSLTLARVQLDTGDANPVVPVGSAQPGQAAVTTHLDAGWEPHLRWGRQGVDSWSAGLGLTPTSGPLSSTFVGSADWRHTASARAYGVRVYAEPVRDSILSYVGLRDPASNQAWGRVVRRGVGADGYTAVGRWSLGGSATLENLQGQSVAGNTHVAVAASLGRDLGVPSMRYFSIGPGLGYEHYDRNLSSFTWGQGGYFSPQQFASAGLSLAFLTEEGRRFVARGRVSVGWQSVRQDASGCFPMPAPISVSASTCSTGYAASRSSGWGSSSEFDAAYLLTPGWEVVGNLGWRTGPAYRDRALFIGLRYNFGARGGLFADDLSGVLRSLW